MKTIVAAVASAVLVASQLESADVIRDRLDRYLIAYEPQLSALVADEEMSQRAQES